MHGLRCIEGLAQAAREQIRDRERMRTLEMHAGGNHTSVTVSIEAHFERLVMVEKGVHSYLRIFSSTSLKVSALREN